MTRPNVFKVRLSDEELQQLEAYAKSKQISAAEAIRDFIKRLPKPKTEGGFNRALTFIPELKLRG